MIVAKDSYQENFTLDDEKLDETTLLLKCLTVICRHFDNIQTVANYQYISSAVTISENIILMVSHSYGSLKFASRPGDHKIVFFFSFLQLFKDKRKPTDSEIEYIKAFSHLIEAIYDPYLTWRSFLSGHFADQRRICNSVAQLHVELVPFIYRKLIRDSCDIFIAVSNENNRRFIFQNAFNLNR